MYCPQCGQQQASNVTRFCSRCGFPLEGVNQILASGGLMPIYPSEPGTTEISARKRGVKQGGMLLLLGVLMVPALAVLWDWTDIRLFGFFMALAAVLLFIGGPLRMIYGAIFEEGAKDPMTPGAYAPPPAYPAQIVNQMRASALSPASTPPAPSWQPRKVTGELVRPPSVTEHTTRLLDKDTDRRD